MIADRDLQVAVCAVVAASAWRFKLCVAWATASPIIPAKTPITSSTAGVNESLPGPQLGLWL